MKCCALAVAIVIAFAASARAQVCNFTIPDINFSDVNLITGAQKDTQVDITITCNGTAGTDIRICPSIGAGSGGTSGNIRQMIGVNGTLNYNLHSNAARTTIWGAYLGTPSGTPPTIDVTIGGSGSVTTTRTLYARVLSGQTSQPATAYSSNFTAAHTQFSYGVLIPLVPLPCPISLGASSSPTFMVSAIGVNNCAVSATNLNFGAAGALSANIDAQSQLSVTCSNGTAYSIGLNGGNANAAPTARQMNGGLLANITYGLYQNAARTTAWGSTIGTNTVAGTGTGSAQIVTVYGRVPPQTTPATGTYTDTIIVTVTY